MPVIITEELQNHVKKVKFEWVSDADGDAEGTTNVELTGDLVGFATLPAAGDDQPTNEYDITIIDSDDIDVLFGKGGDLSNTTKAYAKSTDLGAVVNSKLKIIVENAGNTKKGTAILFIK